MWKFSNMTKQWIRAKNTILLLWGIKMQSLVIDKNMLIQSTLQFPDRREFWPSYHLEIPPCALVCRLKRIQLIMTDGHKICHSSDELMREKLDKCWETDYALMIICVKSIICVRDTYYNLLEENYYWLLIGIHFASLLT